MAQDWNRHQTRTDEVFSELETRFDENWSGTLSATHSDGAFDQKVAYAQGAIDPATQSGSRLVRTLFRSDTLQSDGFDSHLDGRFDAFGLTHQLTIGGNWSEQNVIRAMPPSTAIGRWTSSIPITTRLLNLLVQPGAAPTTATSVMAFTATCA